MNNIEIRLASSAAEVEQGLELYCRSFPGGIERNRAVATVRPRCLPLDFVPEQSIVAVKDGRVVGFLRYCVRRLRLSNVEVQALGVADYCVDTERVSEPTFGVSFLAKCCAILRSLPFPFAFGSARRIMGPYYSAFGFVTCSSYSKCYIEKVPEGALRTTGITCRAGGHESRIAQYEAMRLSTARNDWGVIYRTQAQWRWIFAQTQELSRHTIVELCNGDELVGYFIHGPEGVLDFGFSEGHLASAAAAMFNELVCRTRAGGEIVLPISFGHVIVERFRRLHFRFEHRHVPDEGIIALGLDREILCKLFAEITCRPVGEALRAVFGNDAPASPSAMSLAQARIIVNAVFMGTSQPFFVGAPKPHVLPSTFHRINDLDAI